MAAAAAAALPAAKRRKLEGGPVAGVKKEVEGGDEAQPQVRVCMPLSRHCDLELMSSTLSHLSRPFPALFCRGLCRRSKSPFRCGCVDLICGGTFSEADAGLNLLKSF